MSGEGENKRGTQRFNTRGFEWAFLVMARTEDVPFCACVGTFFFFFFKFWILITVFRLALIETENIRTPSGKLYESLSIVAAAINDSVPAL